MATVTSTKTVKINTSVGDLVNGLLAGDAAANKTWVASIELREKNRAAIGATTAKNVSIKVYEAVVSALHAKKASIRDDREREAAVRRVLEQGKFAKASSLEQYWSQINVAEKKYGVQAKIVNGEVRFEPADGKPVVFTVRTDATVHNTISKKEKAGEAHEVTRDGRVETWGLVEAADGTRRVGVVSTRPAPAPTTASQTPQTPPVKSPEEESKDAFASAPKILGQGLKNPDGSFRTLSDKEQQQAASMAKALTAALAAQGNDFSEGTLKSIITVLKTVHSLPQIKAMTAK